MPFCSQCGAASSGGSFCTECGTAMGVQSSTEAKSFEPTTFENKCHILADLWITYKNDDEFEDFITYNDLGLPLAYAVSTEIAESNPKIKGYVEETFAMLLTGVDREDEGFESLSEILD